MLRSCSTRLLYFFMIAIASLLWAGDQIPKAAWKRPLGLPLQNAGTKNRQVLHCAGRDCCTA